MRALVTGASGFIGRQLCNRLQQEGWQVRALLRKPNHGPWDETFMGALGNVPLPHGLMTGVDVVFHLAGVAHTWGIDPEIYQKVNVEGSKALAEAAEAAGVKGFVYFSSVKATAEPPEDKCVDEGWDQPPADAYGRSKREAETLVLEMAREAGMHAVVLRPVLVYGPGVKGNLARIMRLVVSGWCPPLPDTGNRRSMVHVDDLCSLALLAAESDRAAGQCYIAADAHPISTRALYEGLLRTMGRRVPGWAVPPAVLRMAGRMGDVASGLLNRPLPIGSETVSRLLDSACYSGQKAMDELGWQPGHNLISSLPEMVDAWRKGG